jgi:hypothetical protein
MTVEGPRLSYVYIMGDGRSGSTLLGQMLNNLPDFNYVGQFRGIFNDHYTDNYPCGCGRLFRDCEFWRRVIEGAFGGFENIDRKVLANCNFTIARERFTPFLMLFNRLPSEFFSSKWRRAFEHVMLPLLHSIAQASGKNVIVDSSHEAAQVFVLARLPRIDLKVLHLVRDSRAVAFSRKRDKLLFKSGSNLEFYEKKGAFRSALGWDWRNLCGARIARLHRNDLRYARLRYEDLIRTPAQALAGTLTQLGFPPQDLSFIDAATVKLSGNHAISSHTVKPDPGTVTLRLDDEWLRAMAQRDKRIITLLTLPLMRHFGYMG